MKTSTSVEIYRPIEEVFDFTNGNVAQWSLTVIEDTILESKNDGGVGTTFRCVTEENGRRMEFHGLVTRHDRPRLTACRLTGQYFDIDVEYLFEDLGAKTKLTQNSEVHGKGFTKVMFALFGWFMRKAGCKAQENELLNLKRILEAGD